MTIKVTRILEANCPNSLQAICKATGFLRADVWRRFGALGTFGKSASDLRKAITAAGLYSNLDVDGTIRSETTKDIVNDMLTYKAAAMVKVRQAVAARTKDISERKRLYALLSSGQWMAEPFLHRHVRKHFKHGRSHTNNQFIVRSDKHTSSVVDGRLVITIRVAKKYGNNIKLVTTTTGKNVNLVGSNLRIILKNGFTEVHYAFDKPAGRACGGKALGVDKGYTEAFVDSDGVAHGQTFGAILTKYSDKVSVTGKARNKLHALEKKHRACGNLAKAERIKACNLGRIKLDARREKTQKQLRDIAFKSVHALVDKAGLIASEDLTSPIASKKKWKQYNRKMSSWAKGALADALDSVCTQRGTRHELVNCAYTSQMDSITRRLEGKRVGDKFYRVNGDVLQADYNAASNVLVRLDDSEITRFTPYKEVRRILLARSADATERHGLELSEKSLQPSAD